MPKKADGFIVIARAEPASEPPTAISKPTSVLALVVFGILGIGFRKCKKRSHSHC